MRGIKATPNKKKRRVYINLGFDKKEYRYEKTIPIIVPTNIQSTVEDIMTQLGYGCRDYNLSSVEIEEVK